MTKATDEIVRNFGMANLLAEISLDKVEEKMGVDLGRPFSSEDKTYYPQFPEKIRKQAKEMAWYYEIFYCLEQFLRQTIADRLEAEYGVDWWKEKVPQQTRANAEGLHKKELEEGVTVRSERLIDYISFGELGEIIKCNWGVFQDTFNNQAAVIRILSRMNLLRGPIAHCCLFADDEIDRLKITMKDLFRQMG